MATHDRTKPGLSGIRLLQHPGYNKGTAFSEEERDLLGLRGLLPPRVYTQEEQMERLWYNLRHKTDALDKYIYLISLQDRNEQLFYRLVMENLAELMPIIYTPTVGKACQLFGHIYRRPRGLYITIGDKGRIESILRHWPQPDVDIIVVTDGERILGLGDLGTDGMGIPIGKLSLYTACAGIHPSRCLPVMLDVGTDNEKLQNDPMYMGLPQKRVRGAAYDEFLDEFMAAANAVFPNVLVQLEDFATRHAFELLQRYKDTCCVFDDDIQGTASVAMAGIFSSLRITGSALADQRFLFLGAGEAGVGIAELIVMALQAEGMTGEEAVGHCWFVDSKGLVCGGRDNLATHKVKFAHDHPFIADFSDAVDQLKPTAIIGVSGQGGKFTGEILRKMAALNERPVVFALSNPTSQSECTAEEAYRHTDGRAIFASGSPFDPVDLGGRTITPGQGNNVYVFPGIGLGVVYARSKNVTEEMFLEAARVLAGEVSDEELAGGCIFPALQRIRQVSLKIAAAVARIAADSGLSDIETGSDLEARIGAFMYEPYYLDYTTGPS